MNWRKLVNVTFGCRIADFEPYAIASLFKKA